jgi:hypothetical protein
MARHLHDADIAELFRQEGYISTTGKPYSTAIIRWIVGFASAIESHPLCFAGPTRGVSAILCKRRSPG